MTNREKAILGITAVAAIGAGIYYVFTMTSSATPATTQAVRTDYSALIAKVQVSLKQGELTNREERILDAATTQWLRDPLRSRPLLTQDSGSASAPLPRYIGFINTGPQPIAIIDGRDYRPGEAIRGGEFQLTRIYPDYIELLRRGAIDPVDVPLEKPQTLGGSR